MKHVSKKGFVLLLVTVIALIPSATVFAESNAELIMYTKDAMYFDFRPDNYILQKGQALTLTYLSNNKIEVPAFKRFIARIDQRNNTTLKFTIFKTTNGSLELIDQTSTSGKSCDVSIIMSTIPETYTILVSTDSTAEIYGYHFYFND